MLYTNFICYRGDTIGDNFGGRLANELNKDADTIGKTFFSTQQEKLDSNFVLDLNNLLCKDCSVIIIMLTEHFFDGFRNEDGTANQGSVTRLEIELALNNPNMKFIPVVFNGFTWNDTNMEILKSTVNVSDTKDLLRLTATPAINCPNQRDMTIIDAIAKIRARLTEASDSPFTPIVDLMNIKPPKNTLVIDGMNIDLIKVANGSVEDNYHLLLTKADMDVLIEGETFTIVYLYEGIVKKIRKDVNGIFLNILTPSSDSHDTKTAFGYNLLDDPEKRNRLPFKAMSDSGAMTRKMYLPLNYKKNQRFKVEIHATMAHSILPARGRSKFIFRIPFKKTPLFNRIIPEYSFTIRFAEKPEWVNCTRIIGATKTLFEGQLNYVGTDDKGCHVYKESFGSAPVGVPRVYTFERRVTST